MIACRWFIGVFLLASAGCTLLNAPDPDLLPGPSDLDGGPEAGDASSDSALPDVFDAQPDRVQPEDGGTDAALEGGPDTDAGTDAGADASAPVEDCRLSGDEDGNGLADCADFACAALARCCSQGTRDFDEKWDENAGDRWNVVPGTGSLSPPRIKDGKIVEFGDGGAPRALLRKRCTPLALGVEIEARFTPMGQGDSTCKDEECRAGLVVTAALDALPGYPLADDLAVWVTGQGRVLVTVAGSVIEQSAGLYPAGHELLLSLTITPAADSASSLVARLTVEDTGELGGARKALLDDLAFLSQADLIGHLDGCREVPGLMVAVEGTGDRVQAGRVNATTKQCINPSLFQPPAQNDDTLDAARLGLGAWAAGHLGAPSLLHSPYNDEERWDLMFEATNAPFELETWTHLGYALGHAYSSSWNNQPWSGGTGTVAGDDPPSCIGQDPGCQQGLGRREPSMWGLIGENELQEIRIAYARQAELLTTGKPVRYLIFTKTVAKLPVGPFQEETSPALSPGDLDPFDVQCDSLRDPALVLRGPVPSNDGFWLFFTCERDGAPRSIYAARLMYNLVFPDEEHGEVHLVLSPEQLGEYAAGGVWGPEVVAARNPEDDTTLFRLWFMARGRTGSETVIGMAQGQADGQDLPAMFVPYDANPVLTADSEALGVCQGKCSLAGLSVTPRYDDPASLRLLVARRLQGDSLSISELIPLDQFWKLPWL